ncbi:MAG: T9SS type A sorting domain-containing protein [Candidatus Zixiibacteriota bacterium]|nr:MAG: T9SS type A sorting domain-containing protein [candidate division Zixibacteria bacterium]
MNSRTIGYFIILLNLISTSIALGQAPQVLWTKTYGGPQFDEGHSIDTVSEVSFIVTGRTSSFGWGNYDVWLLKIDQHGDTVWAKTYETSDEEHGNSVIKTEDGGFAVTGQKGRFPFSCQVYTVKTDFEGTIQWSGTYGGDFARSIIQTADGGYLFSGCSPWKFYLVRTDSNGDTLWTGLYSDGYNNYSYDVYEYISPQDSIFYLMAGCTGAGSHDFSWDVYLVMVNEVGDTVSTRRYGDPQYGPDDWASSIEPTADGNFIVAASTKTLGVGGYDIWLMKVNVYGDTLWTRTYGGREDDVARHAVETEDGGFIIVGHTTSYGAGGMDAYIVRTNATGDTAWTKAVGGQFDDFARELIITNKGYIIVGYTESFGAGDRDVYLICLARDIVGIADNPETRNPDILTLSRIYPNPFNASTIIEFTLSENTFMSINLYNILGEQITTLFEGEEQAGEHMVTWDAYDYPSGVYFARLETNNATKSIKMLLLK